MSLNQENKNGFLNPESPDVGNLPTQKLKDQLFNNQNNVRLNSEGNHLWDRPQLPDGPSMGMRHSLKGRSRKLGLPTLDGLDFVNINEIKYIETNSGYTTIYLIDDTTVCTTKKMLDIEGLLITHPFFRIHRSILVNVDYVKRYRKMVGSCYVILEGGFKLPVARRKKDDFLDFLERY